MCACVLRVCVSDQEIIKVPDQRLHVARHTSPMVFIQTIDSDGTILGLAAHRGNAVVIWQNWAVTRAVCSVASICLCVSLC